MKKVIFAMLFATAVMVASCGTKSTETVEVEETTIETETPEVLEEIEEVEVDSTATEDAQ